jgi:hypothetical protein
MPNKLPSAAPQVADSTSQPLASVAAVIEAYEAGKRFNAGPSFLADHANNTRELLPGILQDRERDERRQQQPTVESDDDEVHVIEASVRSWSPGRERDERLEQDRLRDRKVRRKSPDRDWRDYSRTKDRRTKLLSYLPTRMPEPPADVSEDPLATQYSFTYELPAQYLGVSHVDFGNDSATVTTDQLLSRPIDGVTALAINKARWTVRNASIICADLEATAKRSGPADFWVHIQRPANSFATLQMVIQSSTFLSDRERSKAHSFLKKIQQDHEHETELGCILDPGALFCENSKDEKEGVALRFFAFSRLQSRKAAAYMAKRDRVHPSLPFTEIRDSQNEDDESKEALSGNYEKQSRQHQFELAPTWILLIGRHCIITCNDLAQSDIAGDRMNLTLHPSKDPTSEGVESAAQVRVTYCDRVWVVPLEHCRTWTALWATFTKAFVERAWGLAFIHESVILDAAGWESLQRQIITGVVKLRLVKRNDQKIVGSVSVLRQELDLVRAMEKSPNEDPDFAQGGSAVHAGFGKLIEASPLLHLLQTRASSPDGSKAPSTVPDDLHSLLSNNPHPLIRDGYTNYDGLDRRIFLRAFEEVAAKQGDDEFTATKCHFAVHAYYLYTFFWALDFQHSLLSRFWGSLGSFLKLDESGENSVSPLWSLKHQ